jgi:hypothetical protein
MDARKYVDGVFAAIADAATAHRGVLARVQARVYSRLERKKWS